MTKQAYYKCIEKVIGEPAQTKRLQGIIEMAALDIDLTDAETEEIQDEALKYM